MKVLAALAKIITGANNNINTPESLGDAVSSQNQDTREKIIYLLAFAVYVKAHSDQYTQYQLDNAGITSKLSALLGGANIDTAVITALLNGAGEQGWFGSVTYYSSELKDFMSKYNLWDIRSLGEWFMQWLTWSSPTATSALTDIENICSGNIDAQFTNRNGAEYVLGIINTLNPNYPFKLVVVAAAGAVAAYYVLRPLNMEHGGLQL